jgi:hypothetical protein
MKAAGWCGWKWHCDPAFNGGTRAAHPLYDDPYFTPYYTALASAGLPLVCLHFGAPLGNNIAQRDALARVMDRHPELVVIQAHFGIARSWGDLDEHGRFFERYPNLYRDLSVTAQHVSYLWSPAEFRGFCTAYADRLLYATDLILDHRQPGALFPKRATTKYALQFEWLETANAVTTQGIGKRTPRTPETTDGLSLPRSALEAIYWRNAVRIIPHVRDAMAALGYSLPTGEVPKPVQPGTPTPRAQRLIGFLPNVTPADIASVDAEARAPLRGQVDRLATLLT